MPSGVLSGVCTLCACRSSPSGPYRRRCVEALGGSPTVRGSSTRERIAFSSAFDAQPQVGRWAICRRRTATWFCPCGRGTYDADALARPLAPARVAAVRRTHELRVRPRFRGAAAGWALGFGPPPRNLQACSSGRGGRHGAHREGSLGPDRWLRPASQPFAIPTACLPKVGVRWSVSGEGHRPHRSTHHC